MATRKAVRKTSSFTPDQIETIIGIVSDTDVEYDTEQIAQDIAKDNALSELVGRGAIPHITSNSQFQDVVREHSEQIAAKVADSVSSALIGRGVTELRAAVEAAIAQADSPAAARTKARRIASALGTSATGDVLVDFILKYGSPKQAKCPILLLGEQGAGKTYACRGLSSQFDVYVELPCHSGMEARDFLGGFLPNESGKMEWTDMGVSRAFRSAANGKSTLLLIDEIYRVPQRERSIFLTSLSPVVKPDGTMVYRLHIDRPIKAGKAQWTTEEIEAPCHLLTIVATTNIGSQFSVTDDDPAMSERWMHRYVYCDADQIRRVVVGNLAEHDIPEAYAEPFVAFWQRMSAMKKEGTINLVPTVRTLCRAIDCAGVNGEDEDSTIKLMFVRSIMDIAPMWAGTDLDGRMNEAQLKGITDLAHEVFGVAIKTEQI
jgi:MoxR-like ATPase